MEKEKTDQRNSLSPVVCFSIYKTFIFYFKMIFMVMVKTARELALSFEETVEKPHFDRFSFRGKGKIFYTLSEEKKEVNLKLTPQD